MVGGGGLLVFVFLSSCVMEMHGVRVGVLLASRALRDSSLALNDVKTLKSFWFSTQKKKKNH